MSARRLWLVALVVLMVSSPTYALADLEDDLDDVTRRIEEIEKQTTAAGSERSDVVAELIETRDELVVLAADLDAARGRLRKARSNRAQKRDEVNRLERELGLALLRLDDTQKTFEEARNEAIELTRDRYMQGGVGRAAGFVIAAESVADVNSQLAYLDRVATESETILSRYDALRSYQTQQRDRVTAQEEEAAAELVGLKGIEAELGLIRDDVQVRTDAVADVVARQDAALHELDAELSHFANELDQLAKEQDRIEDLIEDEQSGGGSSPNGLIRPVPGGITSAFGPRTHPILGVVRLHTGIDMAAGYGQPIKAAASGRVILATFYGGYGYTVIIDHGGGMVTLYAHQSRLRVSYGESVSGGDIIGEVGTSGLSTGPHLHFEVRINGTPVNPANYL